MAAIAASTALQRRVEHDELARLAVFLTSDLARCITGQLILADAGAFLSRNRPALPFSHGGGTAADSGGQASMPNRSRP
jgi:hypothetical protein